VLDAHQHFWDPAVGDYPWMTGEYAALRRPFGPDDLRPHLVGTGVRATLVVQVRPETRETETLLGMAADVGFIRGVVGWVDLTRAGVAAEIARLRGLRGGAYLVGIRHNVADEVDLHWLLRTDVQRGLADIAAAGLTFDLEIRPLQLEVAAQVAAALPHLRLVLNHLGKPNIASGPDAQWFEGIRSLGSRPGVWAKVSGLVTEADWSSWTIDDLRPFVEHARNVFGTSRLVFGSDWPVCELAATYERVVSVAQELMDDLDQDAQDRVFFQNAQDAYGLTFATLTSHAPMQPA
jgi:L-fucono-1,5-lactonase